MLLPTDNPLVMRDKRYVKYTERPCAGCGKPPVDAEAQPTTVPPPVPTTAPPAPTTTA